MGFAWTRAVFLLTSRFLANVLLLDRCDCRDAVTTIGLSFLRGAKGGAVGVGR